MSASPTHSYYQTLHQNLQQVFLTEFKVSLTHLVGVHGELCCPASNAVACSHGGSSGGGAEYTRYPYNSTL